MNRSNPNLPAARLFLTVLILFCVCNAHPGFANDSVPSLTSDTNLASAGFFRLSWDSHGADVELEESEDADFQSSKLAYRGPDQAAVLSGKADGVWYYRIRAVNPSNAGPWSDPLQVQVEHHPMYRAVTFLALGFLVFTATLGLVVQGMVKFS